MITLHTSLTNTQLEANMNEMTLDVGIAAESISQPRTLVFLAYPQMGLLDLTGAQTVFWAATKAMTERGLPGYAMHTASLKGGLIQSAEGLVVDTRALHELDGALIDTLIVPGAPDIRQAMIDCVDLVQWLRLASFLARRTASVCSGTFLMAQAGLLDGRRAATHWAMCEMLKSIFPSIEVDLDAIFIQQDNVWTSAGVSAGIDMALALVEADCGRDVALQVARELVVFLKRPGGSGAVQPTVAIADAGERRVRRIARVDFRTPGRQQPHRRAASTPGQDEPTQFFPGLQTPDRPNPGQSHRAVPP